MDDVHARHPGIRVEWVTLEGNVLRQNITDDIATGGGQYDVTTVGTYEVPIRGRPGRPESLNDLPADLDVDDLLPAIRGGLTVDGNLYASPSCGESPVVNYRRDPAEKAGIAVSETPTRDEIKAAAAAMTDAANGIHGICLRGKAGCPARGCARRWWRRAACPPSLNRTRRGNPAAGSGRWWISCRWSPTTPAY
jgi:sorbitol/mannitol transport system substrate-binding protein